MRVPDRPVAHPQAVVDETADGWAVLFNPDTAGALALDPGGVLVWRLVDGTRSLADIAAAVRRRFRDAPASVEADVAALLALLAEEGFVGHECRADPARAGAGVQPGVTVQP